VSRIFCPFNRELYGRARFQLERVRERFHGDVCRNKASPDWICPICCKVVSELPYCVLDSEKAPPIVTEFEGIDPQHVVCKTQFINPDTCEYIEEVAVEKTPRRTYSGPTDDNGLPHGGGVKLYASGATYTGSFEHGKRQGVGTLIFPDASRYTGDFNNGKFEGTGVYRWPDGRKFEGYFESGFFINGSYTWNDGRMYQGSFLKDRQHGKGMLLFPDGSKFEGTWENGSRLKGGRYIFSNGSTHYTAA